jgi:hypothetical protein
MLSGFLTFPLNCQLCSLSSSYFHWTVSCALWLPRISTELSVLLSGVLMFSLNCQLCSLASSYFHRTVSFALWLTFSLTVWIGMVSLWTMLHTSASLRWLTPSRFRFLRQLNIFPFVIKSSQNVMLRDWRIYYEKCIIAFCHIITLPKKWEIIYREFSLYCMPTATLVTMNQSFLLGVLILSRRMSGYYPL